MEYSNFYFVYSLCNELSFFRKKIIHLQIIIYSWEIKNQATTAVKLARIMSE